MQNLSRPNPTEENANVTFSKVLNESEKWVTGYDYSKIDPVEYKSKKMPGSKKRNFELASSLFYVQSISECIEYWKTETLDKQVSDEVEKWNNEGMLCAYTSVLLWCLLYENGVFNADEMRMVQGYYRHIDQGILATLGLFGDKPIYQCGLHAWVEVSGSVIDLSIVQEQSTFNFPGLPAIVEDIPAGMELSGWREGKETVKKYARQIAKEQNMNYYEWINYHKLQAEKMAREHLEKAA